MNQIAGSGSDTAADDDLVFIDGPDDAPAAPKTAWKVLIVDDEPGVHTVTKLALSGFSFIDRGVEFLDAYTGQEACGLLREHPDTAVVFLDVVMETDDAGLRAVQRIREELDNKMVRIILRTGQPGHAPEREVVLNYGINEYLAKAELTAQKLYVSLVAALRSYHDLQTIETTRKGLVKILDAAGNMDYRSRSLFVSGLLQQLGSLLDIGDQDLMLIRAGAAGPVIMAASGNYDGFVGETVHEALGAEGDLLTAGLLATGGSLVEPGRSVYRIELPGAEPVLLYLGASRRVSEAELALVRMFCLKIVRAYDNYEFVEQARRDQNAELALLAQLSGHASYLGLDYLQHRSRLAADIARQLAGAAPRLPELIALAAMLADIGNHEIPAAVLERGGPLSHQEQALVRKHCELGAALLDGVLTAVEGGQVMALAREIALSHHECFDGTGYPQQLRGEAIPLAARVVAVADVYLAMTSARPWRAAWSHGSALAQMAERAGTQFDPQVLAAFMAVASAYRSGS
ncbi:MAG: DUF3369 domain-containing protein [Burkholderiaceae bacterium]|nr:DUF3369 domain-containing protein [Burkholderiaceae bacterium]